VEQVKRFAILDRDLSQEAGELTPTLKVKRAVVRANHVDVIEALYSS
jgi:long-chain acyl-CoA synthetase